MARVKLVPGMSAADLRTQLIPDRLPQAEQYRTTFGRALTMDRIQSAITQADYGLMVELTDLESEMLSLDPHLSTVVRKRVAQVTALPWEIMAASGDGIDDDDATMVADVVRSQLARARGMRRMIGDLAWGLYHGRSASEIDWRQAAGKASLEVAGFRWVHPRRLSYGPERELRLIDTFSRRGQFAGDGVALGDYPGKFISWTPRMFCEYPEREGIAPRTLYWGFFKRFSWRMRMILTETFGIPWRVVEVDKDANVTKEALDDARDAAEALGGENTAAIGRGMKLQIHNPEERSGELFGMSASDVNAEMSKLVLGQTSTTDSDANRANSIVGKGEQDIILVDDAAAISEQATEQVVAAIVVANFGGGALRLCPKFELQAQPPRDQKADLERVQMVVNLGVPVPVAQVREMSGIREPSEDEAAIVGTQVFGPLGGVNTITEVVEPGAEPTQSTGATPSGDDPAELPEETIEDGGTEAAAERAEGDLMRATMAPWQLAVVPSGPEPDDAFGSIDAIIERAAGDAEPVVQLMVARIIARVPADPSEADIASAIDWLDAHPIDPGKLAKTLEESTLHSAMLGALEAEWEAENNGAVKAETFAFEPGEASAGFATEPFEEAVASFLEHEVVTRDVFDAMAGEAKRRSFSVAGLADRAMVDVVRDELVRNIASGDDLRGFRKALSKRFQLSGWLKRGPEIEVPTLAGRPWHVETIYRNANMRAASDGRNAQMTDPDVMAARPYWQVVTGNDNRVRKTHKPLHGMVFRADDPSWASKRPPWGHNCRCKLVSRSQRDVDRRGLKVSGADGLAKVPDKGWNDGPS